MAKAREMVETMRKNGDNEGADVWLRVIAAITTLGEPPTGARIDRTIDGLSAGTGITDLAAFVIAAQPLTVLPIV